MREELAIGIVRGRPYKQGKKTDNHSLFIRENWVCAGAPIGFFD